MMTTKITTADCKIALTAAWSEFFGDILTAQAGKWKRVSKSGKAGEPIERVFHHQTLPLHALVVEENGAITRTVIRGFAAFEVGEDGGSEAEQKMLERAQSKEGFDFLGTYPCFRPSDFTFNMCTPEQAEASQEVWYELFPKSDFGRTHAGNDEQLDYLIASYLPEGDAEATEGTFVTERSIDEAISALRAKGFIPDSEFIETSRRKSGGGGGADED